MLPPIFYIDETSSSNAWLDAKMKETSLNEGSMVVAGYQNGGRGQGQNTWESEKGKNLLCSILLKPDFLQPILQFHLSRVIALGCYDALTTYCDDISLKWPNDIYYKNKKLGGILIENTLMGNVFGSTIAGIGINLNQTKFMSDAPNPVSLIQIINQKTSIEYLATQVQINIMKWYRILKEGNKQLLEITYLSHLFRKKGQWPFRAEGRFFKASINTVEPEGRIVLDSNRGPEKFWFKEVEFVFD